MFLCLQLLNEVILVSCSISVNTDPFSNIVFQSALDQRSISLYFSISRFPRLPWSTVPVICSSSLFAICESRKFPHVTVTFPKQVTRSALSQPSKILVLLSSSGTCCGQGKAKGNATRLLLPCQSGKSIKENQFMAPILKHPNQLKKPNVIEVLVVCITQGQDSVYLNTFAKDFLFASVLRSHGGNPLIPAQTGAKCHWIMRGMSLPHFVLGWMTATGLERGRKSLLRFCTAPAAVSALCQRSKTLDYAHVYKVK